MEQIIMQGCLFGPEQDPCFRMPPVKVAKYKKNGYAALPGSGPAGETCKTCAFCVNSYRSFYKCELMRRLWTHSYGTDVLLKSPARRRWEMDKEHG
jgi:hypothetical protein